jgi:hypothetical protein
VSGKPDQLILRADGECEVAPDLARFFVDCEQAADVRALERGSCRWKVESSGEGEGLDIVYPWPAGKWRTTGFGVYRHVVKGDLALLGTCGSGDAYALYRK